jgi:hypothetical protein
VLVGCYASAGLAVGETASGPFEAVDPAAGLALYRVVQEALANAARHGDGTATIDVRVAGDVIVLEADNPLPGPGPRRHRHARACRGHRRHARGRARRRWRPLAGAGRGGREMIRVLLVDDQPARARRAAADP